MELQEKHERELKSLKLEKEQALAEETHATLAGALALLTLHSAHYPIPNITLFHTLNFSLTF